VINVADMAGGVAFALQMTPRARRDAIEGEYQGALKLRVTAAPVDGRANEAVRRLLAGRLKVPISAVRILSGETGRNKRVQVAGITCQQVMALLE